MCRSRFHCVIPNLLHQSCRTFLETWSPAKSLSTKTVILSTCSCPRNRKADLGFPTRYRASPEKQSRILAVPSASGPNALQVLQSPICLGPNKKVSCTQICIVLYLLSSELDSFSRPSTNMSCNFSRDVLTVLLFELRPDSFMMRDACLKSGPMSENCPVRFVPTLNTRFYNKKTCRIRIFESKCSNVFQYVFRSKKCVDVIESIIV